jgi:hypothetical protein
MVRQMLVASTSLGVSSVFGATIGGVLLAVEITSTYYLVAQYFKVSNTHCVYSIMLSCAALGTAYSARKRVNGQMAAAGGVKELSHALCDLCRTNAVHQSIAWLIFRTEYAYNLEMLHVILLTAMLLLLLLYNTHSTSTACAAFTRSITKHSMSHTCLNTVCDANHCCYTYKLLLHLQSAATTNYYCCCITGFCSSAERCSSCTGSALALRRAELC